MSTLIAAYRRPTDPPPEQRNGRCGGVKDKGDLLGRKWDRTGGGWSMKSVEPSAGQSTFSEGDEVEDFVCQEPGDSLSRLFTIWSA
ncbi:hypothetical protein [Corynebacterium humireducens]|uniref:hypothetical protein n=1 Tax=Corynebacterium humireducens TaxID=1223514 RepID=UPI0012E05FFD|nr:hypothetical protein [Corynebacterium humireducens]